MDFDLPEKPKSDFLVYSENHLSRDFLNKDFRGFSHFGKKLVRKRNVAYAKLNCFQISQLNNSPEPRIQNVHKLMSHFNKNSKKKKIWRKFPFC